MRFTATLILALLVRLSAGQADTLQVFTRAQLMQLVQDNHPGVRQALLRSEIGEAAERSARGAFDPRAVAGYREKVFEDKLYYSLLDAGLRVPTWFGAELFGGFEDSGGAFLDPQNRTPGEGLLKAGATVPLGQGLFIDRRRAELQRALAFREMAEAERLRMLNEVLYQVLSDHVDWVAAYRRLTVGLLAVSRAEVRLQAVRGAYRGGDRPAIDTLEALLQLQDRQMRLQDARTGFLNAGLQLSNHLWDGAMRPLEIGPAVVPDTLELAPPTEDPLIQDLVAQAMEEHPRLLEMQGRVQQLDVDRRFRVELLKPQLDLNYTLLANGGVVQGGDAPTWSTADRQWGFNFSMPLLLRRERGELALARLRLNDAELEVDRTRQTIRTTIGRRSNELDLTREQVALGAAMVANYRALFDGETTRFEAGESSLFLVNQREVSYVDSRFQQVELEARLRRAYFILERDAGVLWRTVLP
jgi:outer membrane protein TolC